MPSTHLRSLYALLLLAVALAACGPMEQSPGDGASAPDAAPAGAADEEPMSADRDSVVVDDVVYRADTRIMESYPVQLATVVTMTNRSDAPKTIDFPNGCVALLRAYRDEARAELAWDQARLVMCTQMIVQMELAPGASDSAQARTDAGEILAEGLPAGRYWLEAVLRPNGTEVRVPAGSAELAN